MKFALIFLIFIHTNYAQGQAEERFDPTTFNQKYLEHLVKTKVDEVRTKYDCAPLVNDSILYIASHHHARYLTRKGRLSHTEDDSTSTKTPQLRAEFFGAKNYHVGENVLYTPYNSIIENKKGETLKTNSYEEIADAMVDSWVNSPGHFKNIITKEYQITGLSVSIDPEKGRIYACQKFAIVDFKFTFEENKDFFSYSEYVPPPIVSSFDGISHELIEHTYPYKLRHDKPEKCESCLVLEPEKPYLTLRIEGNKFILKVENSEYVRKLIRERNDGFAVEIVTYYDYMCGNPAYYTKPSRRNDQLKLNGFTLEPLYRKELFKGYKKRKKKKEVRYLPYIFRKDSVSFFKRFGQYKADSYSSAYFEISLGKVPKDIDGLWNHNLVYIQNKQICSVDYFTAFCSELFSEYRTSEFIPLESNITYQFLPKNERSNFTIPFEQGQVNFTDHAIEPLLSSMGELKFNIDSIEIHAYASIEGDSTTNQRLQLQRAQNIASLIQSRQTTSIQLTVETSTDWDGFYQNATKSSQWKSLSTKSKAEIESFLRSNDPSQLESLLAPTRRGDISIYATIPVTKQNLAYLIQKENEALIEAIAAENDFQKRKIPLASLEALYEYTHHLVMTDSLLVEKLATFKLLEQSILSPRLIEQFLLYGYQFESVFTELNPEWKRRRLSDMEYLSTNLSYQNKLSPEFLYQLARLKTEAMKASPPKKQEQVQEILDIMSRLKNAYELDTAFEKNIDQVNFDLNVMLLNEIFTLSTDPLEGRFNASKSIAQLWELYSKYREMTEDKALALAKCAVHYADIEAAVRMLQPYTTSDSIVSYLMPLSWNHPSKVAWGSYYDYLIELSHSMDINVWCNMFIDECQIPFQAFDHEALRDRFCEECMDKNKVILKLKGTAD